MSPEHRAEVCARVRALLRERADGDLDGAERRLVDDHIHGCAACGEALSRAEFEVLVLRRALAGEAAIARTPPADLAARVRRRVLADADLGPSPDFTRVVMERVSKEYRPRRPAMPRVARRLAVAAMAVVGIALAVVMASRSGAPAHVARVVAADGPVELDLGGGRAVPVAAGMELAAGTRLRSAAGAEAVLELGRDELTADGAAARVAWQNRCALELDAERVVLRDGAVRIEARRELRLAGLADAEARLAPGSYDVRVAPRRRFDGSLSVEPLLAVRLEVLEGRATIHRGARETAVEAGSVAHFGHWQPVEIEPGLSPRLLTASQRRGMVARADPIGTPERLWRGRVVDARTGAGVAGARVALDVGEGAVELACGEDGSFELPATGARLAVVEIAPPAGSGLAPLARRPLGMPPSGGQLDTLVLEAGARAEGTVRDARGAPLAGAHVVPCVVDELFGLCELRRELATTSGADGGFTLGGLPARLGPRQVLALVVEHREHPTTAVGALDALPAGRLDVTMHAPRDLELGGLPASRRVEIAQSVPGLAASVFAVRTEVVTDAAGRAWLRGVGPGRLWLQERATGRAVALVGDDELGAELRPARGDGPVTILARTDRPATRYARYRAQPPVPTGYLTVVDGGSLGVPGTRLFLLSAGEIEFLGEYTGLEALPFAAPDGEFAIVAIGPDGSFGWQDGAALGAGHGEIRVAPPGAVELDVPAAAAERVRAAHLRFRMADGPLAGQEFVREVRIEGGARVEDLVPGAYVIEFDDGSQVEVEVEGDGSVRVGLPVGALGLGK